jgi:hypothetical protein
VNGHVGWGIIGCGWGFFCPEGLHQSQCVLTAEFSLAGDGAH